MAKERTQSAEPRSRLTIRKNQKDDSDLEYNKMQIVNQKVNFLGKN